MNIFISVIITIVFIICQLLGAIHWSWWLVFSILIANMSWNIICYFYKKLG